MIITSSDILIIERVEIIEHSLFLHLTDKICLKIPCIESLEFRMSEEFKMICVIDYEHEHPFQINDPNLARDILDFYGNTNFPMQYQC